MRLLNATTFKFKDFNDAQLPPYAILSHTWGSEEVSYKEIRFVQQIVTLPKHLRKNDIALAALTVAAGIESDQTLSEWRKSFTNRAGLKKILGTAKLASEKLLDWIWVDTCCIDKSSSAELQEAINSMYRWYQRSTYCVVHLEDAEPYEVGQPWALHFRNVLRDSKWITRGWTLQELIAPSVVDFHDSSWLYIGSKQDDMTSIRVVTGIPEYVLATGDLSRASVAQKMSWAAKRTTTRREDRAYSLLGIFNVHLPLLYGERENAFLRLQEEIMRTTPDDSIFAWSATEGSLSTYRGLLARSPEEFGLAGSPGERESSQLIYPGHGTFATSNLGLRVEMRIRPYTKDERDTDLYLGMLHAPCGDDRRRIALVLRKLKGQQFARVAANSFEDWDPASVTITTALYIEHTPRIPLSLKSRLMHCFYFRRSSSETPVPSYVIRDIYPGQLATYEGDAIRIPRMSLMPQFMKPFNACIRLDPVENQRNYASLPPPIYLLLGYHYSTGRYWCKAFEPGECKWPEFTAPVELWRAVLQDQGSFEDYGTEATFNTGHPDQDKIVKDEPIHDQGKIIDEDEVLDEPRIHIRITPGLYQDQIALIVDIDGLGYASQGLNRLRNLTLGLDIDHPESTPRSWSQNAGY
jgi:hypothetical protein